MIPVVRGVSSSWGFALDQADIPWDVNALLVIGRCQAFLTLASAEYSCSHLRSLQLILPSTGSSIPEGGPSGLLSCPVGHNLLVMRVICACSSCHSVSLVRWSSFCASCLLPSLPTVLGYGDMETVRCVWGTVGHLPLLKAPEGNRAWLWRSGVWLFFFSLLRNPNYI